MEFLSMGRPAGMKRAYRDIKAVMLCHPLLEMAKGVSDMFLRQPGPRSNLSLLHMIFHANPY